jgi:hypothetical protein
MEEEIKIKLIISKNNYPILFQLKKEELNNISNKIFSLGYSILYPNINICEKSNEYNDIINKIEILSNNINNNNLGNKINSLEQSLEKLIGLSSSSSKKGELAENILENIFMQRYGDIQFKNMSQTPHSGDAWLYLPNDKIVMLESKNYTNTVNKDEIIKVQNDMITQHIKWGIFISFNSNIQGMKEFDFYIFNHNNENYHIIMISNLSIDISRLDLAISLVRKLITMYSDLEKFPWIVNNIKSELNYLNELLEQNYLLRDNFVNMERDIVKNINIFYNKLREYQFNMDNKIKHIIQSITSTIEESININSLNYDELYSLTNDKKILIILTKISDVFKNKNIIYTNNNLLINDSIIGNIKVKLKKVSIELTNYDILLNFNIGKDKEITQNLLILENLNL